MAGPALPLNIDSGYADNTSDPSVKVHQQHHDAIHDVVNMFDKDIAPTDGQVLTWNAATTLYEPSTPTTGGGGTGHATTGIYLDDFTGTDDQRLTSAIAAQQASVNRRPIVLPNRNLSFNTVRSLYAGCTVIGEFPTGQNIATAIATGPVITLGGSITSGASSWWVAPGGNMYDVYMANFTVQGSQSGVSTAQSQFMDVTVGTLYGCEFFSLSFNFMRGVMGFGATRKCLATQVCFSGSWTSNNAWDTQFNVGGSDCIFWMDSFNNIGVSRSSSQTGNINRYFLRFDSLEATLGKIYISTMNGWRGLLISGDSYLELHGGVYEGFKGTRQIDATNPAPGHLSGPGPGTQIRITNGSVAMFGTKIGQGMDNPDPSEGGLLQVEGGEVHLSGVQFYGRNQGVPVDTTNHPAQNAIYHTNGRLSAIGILKRTGEGAFWSGRPVCDTGTTAGSGSYSFYLPDQSMTVI